MAMTAQVSRTIAADTDTVWEALTSKAGMKAWMMGADVETDWNVGSPITIKGEIGGRPFADRGEVRAFEPGKRLSYTHQSGGQGQAHLVTVEIAPKNGVTEVTITQANVDGSVTAADREHKAQYEETWGAMLEGLERAVRP